MGAVHIPQIWGLDPSFNDKETRSRIIHLVCVWLHCSGNSSPFTTKLPQSMGEEMLSFVMALNPRSAHNFPKYRSSNYRKRPIHDFIIVTISKSYVVNNLVRLFILPSSSSSSASILQMVLQSSSSLPDTPKASFLLMTTETAEKNANYDLLSNSLSTALPKWRVTTRNIWGTLVLVKYLIMV